MVRAMGTILAMRSLEWVLATHRRDLELEALDELPSFLRLSDPAIDLVNERNWIERWVTVFWGGAAESFELRRLDLYELVDRYPELDLCW